MLPANVLAKAVKTNAQLSFFMSYGTSHDDLEVDLALKNEEIINDSLQF